MDRYITIAGQTYRRHSYNDEVMRAMSLFFPEGIPQDRLAMGDPKTVSTVAFCFLDGFGREQFEYNPDIFYKQIFAGKLSGAKVATEAARLRDEIAKIINDESAQELAASPPEQSAIKKKSSRAIVTFSILNILLWLLTLAFLWASGAISPSSIDKVLSLLAKN